MQGPRIHLRIADLVQTDKTPIIIRTGKLKQANLPPPHRPTAPSLQPIPKLSAISYIDRHSGEGPEAG